MPTRSEAATTATEEARIWAGFVGEWTAERHPALWNDLPPSEAEVVRFYQPDGDLARRARYWGYEFGSRDLADLARFGAGLARAEADAWERDEPHIATRAYADRRFLLGDRLLHWAVPWLDAAARCHPAERDLAEPARFALLDLGDRLRPAPILSEGQEGLFPPGEDSYGPLDPPAPLAEWLLSVWSGRVMMRSTLTSLGGAAVGLRVVPAEWLEDPHMRSLLSMTYEVIAPRWDGLALEHPGSAQLWRDLSRRARGTARRLEAAPPD